MKPIFKKENLPFAWDDISQGMYNVLKRFVSKRDNILEFGSSTGHISFRLAKEGYSITLLDIRKEVIEQAQDIFLRQGLSVQAICKDIFNFDGRYDFSWNSGLIQCLNDDKKRELLSKISEISSKILIFYPDTANPRKICGIDQNEIPGVGNAKEYPVANIPNIAYDCFNEIHLGFIGPEESGLNYNMYWLYAKK